MKVINDYSFFELTNICWGGAKDTLKTIEEYEKEDEFMDYLENRAFFGVTPTLTQLNDFLWFDDEIIFADLGINTEEEEN